MSSYATPYRKPVVIHPDGDTYARFRDRAVAFVVVFLVGITFALVSDLVLGVSTEIVTYGVVILVILLLGGLPTISRLLEWKRSITGVTVRQQSDIRILRVAWAQYAQRLNELEAHRAQVVSHSNRARLAELMNEKSKVRSSGRSQTAQALIASGNANWDREQEVLQGAKAHDVIIAGRIRKLEDSGFQKATFVNIEEGEITKAGFRGTR